MKKTRLAGKLCVILLAFGPAVWVSQAQDVAPEVLHYADIVFYNGHVLTMDQDQPPFSPGPRCSRWSDSGSWR